MAYSKQAKKLFMENSRKMDDCNLCAEVDNKVGAKARYGTVILKTGNKDNGWFATLSPRTGGNPKHDFTVQLMPQRHLTHFSQIGVHPGMAEQFGICFSLISKAMTAVMMQSEGLLATAKGKGLSVALATYGKSTTWTEKKEHLHLKLFPFRGNIGQPYTVDSSFEKKEIYLNKNKGVAFVTMTPVKKVLIDAKKYNKLVKDLLSALN